MNKREERRARKREVFCTLGIQGKGWIEAPGRPVTKCDAVKELPKKFYVPEAGTPAADVYVYPSPLLVGNQETTAQCTDNSEFAIGDQVTIGEGTYVTPIPWSVVGALESWQIKHLNSLDAVSANNYLSTNGNHIPSLVSFFKLSNLQAQALSTEFLDTRNDLQSFTNKQANSRLGCSFFSAQQASYCEDDTIVLIDTCAGELQFQKTGVPSVVAAGEYRSLLSQEDADSQAIAAASNALRCTYSNLDDISIACCDTFARDPNAKYPFKLISNFPSVDYKPGELTGGSLEELRVTISNARRFVLACRCEVDTANPTIAPPFGKTAVKLGVVTADTCEQVQDIIDVDIETLDPCSDSVTCQCPPDAIPKSLFYPACYLRDTTKSLATTNVYNECVDTLVCVWCNDAKIGVCEGLQNPFRPGFSFAGEFCSEESKADANDQAQEAANDRTLCTDPDDDPVEPDEGGSTQNGPWGVSGSAGACCLVDVNKTAFESKFYTPQAPTIPIDAQDIDETDLPDCAQDARFIYIEADLVYDGGQPDQLKWSLLGGEIAIKAYSTARPLLSPFPLPPGVNYNTARRLIAQTEGGAADCSDLNVIQSVNTAQKLIVAYDQAQVPYPLITDYDTPLPTPPSVVGNAFQRVFQNSGNWWLQGGQVTGGTGSFVIDDIDLGIVGSEPVDGNKFWLEVVGDGVVVDGQLFSGFNATAAADFSGGILPAATLPTIADNVGRKFYLLLGTWYDSVFQASGPGHLNVVFCPGIGYDPRRF